jgi:hypothetical protein
MSNRIIGVGLSQRTPANEHPRAAWTALAWANRAEHGVRRV